MVVVTLSTRTRATQTSKRSTTLTFAPARVSKLELFKYGLQNWSAPIKNDSTMSSVVTGDGCNGSATNGLATGLIAAIAVTWGAVKLI